PTHAAGYGANGEATLHKERPRVGHSAFIFLNFSLWTRSADSTHKARRAETHLWGNGALSAFPIEPFVFSIRKTIRLSLRSVISTLSPVSRMRLGISITDRGSVQSTSSLSPAASDLSAFRVFKAGNGHFRPARSSFVVVVICSK